MLICNFAPVRLLLARESMVRFEKEDQLGGSNPAHARRIAKPLLCIEVQDTKAGVAYQVTRVVLHHSTRSFQVLISDADMIAMMLRRCMQTSEKVAHERHCGHVVDA